jgi:hypothetical protein
MILVGLTRWDRIGQVETVWANARRALAPPVIIDGRTPSLANCRARASPELERMIERFGASPSFVAATGSLDRGRLSPRSSFNGPEAALKGT